MGQDQDIIKVAEISPQDVESINRLQSDIRTLNNKDVVLIAYEKR
jgi:hypothetical protein